MLVNDSTKWIMFCMIVTDKSTALRFCPSLIDNKKYQHYHHILPLNLLTIACALLLMNVHLQDKQYVQYSYCKSGMATLIVMRTSIFSPLYQGARFTSIHLYTV